MNRDYSRERRRRSFESNPILGMAMASLVGAIAWSALVGVVLLVAG